MRQTRSPSQKMPIRRYWGMSSRSDITDLIDAVAAPEAAFDFEAVFRAHYPRIARVIARVVRNDARSEELAVEVFLKLWRSPRAQGDKAGGWLYRVAARKALDDLRLFSLRCLCFEVHRAAHNSGLLCTAICRTILSGKLLMKPSAVRRRALK